MFTPVQTTLGALLLHLATTSLLFDAGAILGASGFILKLLRDPKRASQGTTIWYFLGMITAVLLVRSVAPELLPRYPTFNVDGGDVLRTTVAGLLTGWGVKNCGGCTSGHMLCGIGRLSLRSVIATAIFFPVAVITFQLSNPSLETAACGSNSLCYEPIYPSRMSSAKLSLLLLFVYLATILPVARQNHISANKTFLTAGLAFGLGLFVTGMADPAKVQAFFAIDFRHWRFNLWDPSLSFIILFALIPNILRIRLRGLEKSPTYVNRFDLPNPHRRMDVPFVFGAVAFGVAWGLTGVCPGPAVLRSLLQPSWGLCWMLGFYIGGIVVVREHS